MHPRRRHERSQAREEVERLEHHMRRAVAIGALQLHAHIAALGGREPLLGNGRAAYVSAQRLELAARACPSDADACVQEKPAARATPSRSSSPNRAGTVCSVACTLC